MQTFRQTQSSRCIMLQCCMTFRQHGTQSSNSSPALPLHRLYASIDHAFDRARSGLWDLTAWLLRGSVHVSTAFVQAVDVGGTFRLVVVVSRETRLDGAGCRGERGEGSQYDSSWAMQSYSPSCWQSCGARGADIVGLWIHEHSVEDYLGHGVWSCLGW